VKPRIRKPLRKGSLVYHGTSSEEEFTDLNGPVWVSNAKGVADFFATWQATRQGRPRVLMFRVREAPRLAVLYDDADCKQLVEWVRSVSGVDIEHFEDFGELAPHGLVEAMCRTGIDGWHIPENYKAPKGSDTIICYPDRFLEYIETIEVVHR